MTRSEARRSRLSSVLAVLATLAFIGLIAAAFVSTFNMGVTTGMMAAGAAVIVYQVPAVALDWPRLTFEHILEFFGWLWDMISSLWS